MSRIFVVLFVGGIALIIMGCHDFFIQVGTSSEPTTISIAELERLVPWNRNLIVTGGHALIDDAVVYYKTRNYTKVAGSDIYFIPIQDAALAAYRSFTPILLVRMTEAQVETIKSGTPFHANKISGIRMTHLELKSEAADFLAKRYGHSAVKKMVILEYQKEVTGVGAGIGQILGGLGCLVGIIVLSGPIGKRRFFT